MQTPAESPLEVLEAPGAGWAKPSKPWSDHDYDELKKAGTKIEYSTLYGNTQGAGAVRKCVCCDHEYTGSPKAMRIHVRAKTEMDKPGTRKDVKECQPKTQEGRDWLKECKEAIERRDAKPLGEKGRGKKKEANREAVTAFDKLRHVPSKEMVDKAWAHAFVKNNISVGTIDDEHFRRAVCLSVMRGRTFLTDNDKSEYPERSADVDCAIPDPPKETPRATEGEATADVQRGQDEEEDDDDLFGDPAKDFDAYESDEEPVAAPPGRAREEEEEQVEEEEGRPRRRVRPRRG